MTSGLERWTVDNQTEAARDVTRTSASTGGGQRRSGTRGRRAWWYAAVNLLTAVGLVTALAQWGWPAPTATVLSVAVLTVSIAAVVLPGNGLRPLLRTAWMGLLLGAVLTAVTGLATMFGPLVLVLVVLLALTTPGLTASTRTLWRRVRHGAQPKPTPVEAPSTDLGPPPPPPRVAPVRAVTTWSPEDVTSLDDASLCMAWRRSFLVLESAASVRQRVAVVEHRQRCLDELQRRSPGGVAAWLSSGARASGNPLPYLEGHGAPDQ